MKEQNKQRLLSGLGWINILIFFPIFFFTAIYNAKVYVLRMHTAEANWLFLAYVAQIILLLSILIAAILMQLNIKQELRKQALTIIACQSVLCFVYGVLQVLSHHPMHLYGWILSSFFTSYTGVALFLFNVLGFILYFHDLKIKNYITKFVMTSVFLFAVCLVYIYFMK